MADLDLPLATPHRLTLTEVLTHAGELPGHVLVYLPTRRQATTFAADTQVILFDSGVYDEHLLISLDGQPVEPDFPGYSPAFNGEIVQGIVEAARLEGPATPEFLLASFNHYYDHDAFLPGEASQTGLEGYRVNPLEHTYLWDGREPGWVILRSNWGAPLLMHRPTRTPLALPALAVNYDDLVQVAREHGVPEVDAL